MLNSLLRRPDPSLVSALPTTELTAADYISLQRRRQALALLSVLLLTGGGAWLVLRFQFIPPLLLLACVLLAGVCWQPRIGFYVTFGLVLLFEAGGPDPLMEPGRYLNIGLQGTLGVTGFITSPLELLILLVLGVLVIQGLVQHKLLLRGGHLFKPVLLFYLAVLWGIVWGALSGGDLYIAFWEARALLYILICFLIAASAVKTYRHVAAITGISLVCIGLFSVEGAYRNLVLVHGALEGTPEEFIYSHDTVIFLGTLLLLVLAQNIFGASRWQRLLGICVAPISLYTMLATQRRAGYIALIVAFLALSLILLFTHRKAFFLCAVPILVAGAVYMPLFWNSEGMLGQPARAVRSLSDPSARDAASNQYRDLEKVNVIASIQSDPLRGLGFGREFLFVVPLPDISFWPFWHYEPHHNLLWVWLKTGAIGFTLFWVLMGTSIMRASHLIRVCRRREARVFAIFALVGIIQTLVFCYVDLGLVDGRVTVFLGTLMGTLSVLDEVHD